MNLFTKTKYAYYGAIILAILSGIVSAMVVWSIAPEVGGELWPYIRVVLSSVVGAVVGKIVAVITIQAASFYFIDELFSFGNAGDPWGDAEVESLMDKFEEDE